MATIVRGNATVESLTDGGVDATVAINLGATPAVGNLLVFVFGGRDSGNNALPVFSSITDGFTLIGVTSPMEYHIAGIAWKVADGTETGFITVTFTDNCYSKWAGVVEFNEPSFSDWALDASSFNGSGATDTATIDTGTTGTLTDEIGVAVIVGTSRTGSEGLTTDTGTSLSGTDADFEVDAGAANYIAAWLSLTATTALNATISEGGASRMGAGIAVFVEAGVGPTTVTGTATGTVSVSGTATATVVQGVTTGTATGTVSVSGTATDVSPATIIDNFTYSDGALDTVSSVVWDNPVNPSPHVGTGQLRAPDQSITYHAIHQTALGSVNHYAEADVTFGANYSESGVIVRSNVGGTSYYRATWSTTSTARFRIHKNVGGVYTQIATSALVGSSGVKRLRLEANGNQLTLYVDDVQELTVSDSDITTGSYVGVEIYRTTGTDTNRIDNFEAGTLSPTPPGTTTGTATGTIAITGIVGGTLDTNFDGVALADGWTFAQNSTGNATLSVANGFATITNPVGVVVNSVSSLITADNTAGLVHDVSGDFDVAVRVASMIGGQNSTLAHFIVRGATDGEMVRWGLFGNATESRKYGYARSGGAGDIFQPEVQLTGWSPVAAGGHPAWMRVKRVGSVYTFYLSGDGATWVQENTVTIGVVAATLKLAVGQYSLNLGTPFRWDKVVDLGAAATTDARSAIPALNQFATQTTDLTTVPGWLATSSAVDGTVTLTGTSVVLGTAPADGSNARLTYVGAGQPGSGMLLRVDIGTTNIQGYAAFGLANLDGGANIDQYSAGPLYGVELKLSTLGEAIPIRVHRPLSNDVFDEPYTFLAPATETGQASTWWRIERFAASVRMRWWLDGAAEPATWWFEGEDDVLSGEGNMVPYVCVSHNTGQAITATMAVSDVSFYGLTTGSANLLAGTTAVDAVRIGSDVVSAIYYGTVQVF